ncbi:Galactokinase [uncultured archaeon]|nr:Galactokinase [uncultured archaeon]
MIISKTPYRVDLVGDGTDIGSFCERERGCIINAAIKKYIYVIVHPSSDKNIRIICDNKIENVTNPHLIKNGRVREAMKIAGICEGIEIYSIAEVNSGTGLGGSSSFTVGVLNALHNYKGNSVNLEKLAEEASEIEIDILKEPIGRQDQYVAALGGLNKMEFINKKVIVSPLTEEKNMIDYIEKNMMMFYLGGQRQTSSILKEQDKEMRTNPRVFNSMVDMRNLADYISKKIKLGRGEEFGKILNENWVIKKELISSINNPFIEKYHRLAMELGAEGAKLSGAGGVGFLLIYIDYKKQEAIRNAFCDLEEYKFKFENRGSRIIYNN